MKNIILHIPHSSTVIPKEYINQYIGEVDETVLNLTDTFIDDLFDVDDCTKFIFPYSRVFCDVERLKDNESMEEYGHGIIYTNDINLNRFRDITESERTEIIEKYYNAHHETIYSYVKSNDVDLILDCHSFSNLIYPCTPFKDKTCFLPDICIGYNGDSKSRKYAEFILNFFADKGYVTKLNEPYKGSFSIENIPSVMIEINKRLYLEDDMKHKRVDYYKIKALIKFLIKDLQNVR